MWNRNNEVAELTIETDNNRNPENSYYYVAILGESYGREGFEDGKLIHTSAIKELTEDGKVVTYSGSVYDLGEKHPDYVAFEKAVNEGLPILKRWSISKLSDGDEVYICGYTEKVPRPNFAKKIIAQEGAVITAFDGTKVFVDWISIGGVQKMRVMEGSVKGRMFCGLSLQPDISANDWTHGIAGGAIGMSVELAKKKGII